MKHVRIDAPSASRPPLILADDLTSRSIPQVDGTGKTVQWHQGIAVPRHMVLPGQDGFRTPTAEDFELESREPHGSRHESLAPPTPSRRASSQSSEPRPQRPLSYAELGCNSMNASTHSLGERLLERLQWRQRVRHFTWTFFTITMATGGIANVLYSVPFRFRGLYALGVIFFLLNIVLFLINVVCITLRFCLHPATLKASILHPTERLFMPAAVVSFGTILLNISQYGPVKAGHWLNDAVAVLFYLDAGLALLASMSIYLVMWSTESFTISQMTPVWIFPAYPLLILGPHAAVLSKTVTQTRALDIIVAGFTLQGIGFMVSLMIYSAFIYRLMTQKLPQEALRPGMFVSVGPCGFTVAALIGLGEGSERAIMQKFNGDIDPQLAATILRVIASWASLWLWGLALWFFFISVASHHTCLQKGHHLTFTMTWFSYVFPNTALITATFAIGRAFQSRPIQILGCVMTVLLVIVWFCVVAAMIRAIVLRQILWPQKGEDKDEGGFKGPVHKRETV